MDLIEKDQKEIKTEPPTHSSTLARLKAVNWRKWIGRVATVGKAGLEIYLAAKKKEYLSIGATTAGLVKEVSDWDDSEEGWTKNEVMKRFGVRPLSWSDQRIQFLVNTVREAGIDPFRPYIEELDPRGEEKDPYDSIIVLGYRIADTTIYIWWDGNYPERLYGESSDKLLAALSTIIKERFGDSVALSIMQKGFGTSVGLGETSQVQLDTYVTPVDVDDFCKAVQHFASTGLGRASLLYGPPGTGKTTFASLVASRLQGRLLVIEAPALNQAVDHGISVENLITLTSPRVVLFDDLDRVDELDELLGEMERLNHSKDKMLILASVNELQKLPDALRRPGRFDEIIRFTLPGLEMRKQILKRHIESRGTRLCNAYIAEIARQTRGFSGASLREMALQVCMRGYNKNFVAHHAENMRLMGEVMEEGDKEAED